MASVTSATVKRKRPSGSARNNPSRSRVAPKGRVAPKDRVARKGRIVPPGAAAARGTGEALARLDHKAVEEICRAHGHRWREGKLTPGKTVEHFAWQVLMGNPSCDAVRHHGGCAFSSPAYCMARQRLPLAALKELGSGVAAEALALAGRARRRGGHRWKGKRVFRIDGSSTSLPDSAEVRKHFGLSNKQKPGCGYPTAHLLVLTGPAGVAVDVICSPLRTGDMTHAVKTHCHLVPGDLMMGDGQFCGWGHLWTLAEQGLSGLFPAHHSRAIGWGERADHGPNRQWLKSLGYYDQLVQYRKPERRPKWMSRQQFADAPQWITVREVRRSVWAGGVRRMITIVTTLTNPKKYPAKELVKLLGERWCIELDIRSLKTTMGMEQLKSRSVEGVKKELAMYLIVYNLVRLRMLRAAARQKVPLARVSFADALASLRYGCDPEAELKVNPHRPGRWEPRVVKKRPKAYPKMSKPRPTLRRQLLARRKAALA